MGSDDMSAPVPVRRQPDPFWLKLALLAGAIGVVAAFGSPFLKLVLVTAGIYAIVVLGLNILTGYCGQVSFGHNAFMAVGAYAAALGTTRYGLDPWLAMVLGVALAGLVALLIGYPVLRLRGHYLGAATLAFGLAVYAFAANSEFTNGFIGVTGIPALHLFGIELRDRTANLLAVWVCVALALVSVYLVGRGKVGALLNAVRDDEELAAACGLNVGGVKVIPFALSAVYAAAAGALYAYSISYINAEPFGLQTVAILFITLFVGGLRRPFGSVLAAAILTLAPQELSWLQAWYPTTISLALLIFLVGLGLRHWPTFLGGKLRV